MLRRSNDYYLVRKIAYNPKEAPKVEEYQIPVGNYNSAVVSLLEDGYEIITNQFRFAILGKVLSDTSYESVSFEYVGEWEEN